MILLDPNRKIKKYALIAGAAVLIVAFVAIFFFSRKEKEVPDFDTLAPNFEADMQKRLDMKNALQKADQEAEQIPQEEKNESSAEMTKTLNAEEKNTIPAEDSGPGKEVKDMRDALNSLE